MKTPDKSCASSAAPVEGVIRLNSDAAPEIRSDIVAVEEPLEIRVNAQSVSVTMRTPGHDDELAAGFLLTEGMIHDRADIASIGPCQSPEALAPSRGNIINITLAEGVTADLAKLTRHVFASSSCGLCGKASIANVQMQFPPIPKTVRLPIQPDTLRALPHSLRAAQETFSRTGGLHAAGIFDWDGNLLVVREDVGRHNAVDKVLGYGLLAGLFPFSDHILLVSGRASFEILQKSLAARIPVVAAVSAPSSLAVSFAEAGNQTLVGFLRDASFNVYTHPHRVAPAESARPGT